MTPRFTRLGDVLRVKARAHAERIALRADSRQTSYRHLDEYANRVANGLIALGVRHGHRVAYLGPNSDKYVELMFGAARAGATLTAINWKLTNPEILYVLQDCEPRVLFADPDVATRLESLLGRIRQPGRLIPLASATGENYRHWRDQQSPDDPAIEVSPDVAALQLYTSGTTGRPKGVMLSHRSLLAFRSIAPEEQPVWNRWTQDDVFLLAMPQFHIGGSGFGLQTICAGGTAVVMPEFDVDSVLEAIQEHRPTKLFAVPSALRKLIRSPRISTVDISSVKTILYGASPIELRLLEETRAVFRCGFVQVYGMTEMGGTICALSPQDHESGGPARLISAGRALPGVEIRIVDPNRSEVSTGKTGEIAIRSPTAMTGYWQMKAETSAVLDAQGWYFSGDAGYVDADGYLYIVDRIVDVIISGGENISPAEVENAIAIHPAVSEVAVIGVPSSTWGEEVRAVVVAAPGSNPDAEDILRHARSLIAAFKVPKAIDFAASLPRTASGKILRQQLRDKYWSGRQRRVN